MNVSAVNKRLQKLEERLCPDTDETFTLEQLSRAMWRKDKSRFRKLAKQTGLGHFVRQFEFEDAERTSATRRQPWGRNSLR